MFYLKNNTGAVTAWDDNRFPPVAFVLPGIDGLASSRVRSTTNARKGFGKIPLEYAKTDITGRSRMRGKTISAGAYQ